MTIKDEVLAAEDRGMVSVDEAPPSAISAPEDSEPATVPPAHAERAGVYLAMLMALAVPSLIVLAFFLASDGRSSESVNVPANEQTQSTGLDQLEIGDALPPELEEIEVPDIDVDVPVELPDGLTDVDPNGIEVAVYDESPSVSGEFTFAIRVKNLTIDQDIDIEYFTVSVENAEGEVTNSSIRFLHESLPVSSSAIAAVRAADTGSQSHFVVVALGDVEVARTQIDVA